MLDRFAIGGAGTAVALRRLRLADLSAFGGGAVLLRYGAILEVHGSEFQRCSATYDEYVRRRRRPLYPLIPPSSSPRPRPRPVRP